MKYAAAFTILLMAICAVADGPVVHQVIRGQACIETMWADGTVVEEDGTPIPEVPVSTWCVDPDPEVVTLGIIILDDDWPPPDRPAN